MPTTEDEITITEISEFEPSRVDGVGKGANGFPILMLKSIDGEVTETETDLDGVLAEVAAVDLDKAEATDEVPDATVEDVLAEVSKRMDPDDDRPLCKFCKGNKMINDGKAKCPRCKGTGFQPKVGQTEKELLAEATKESGVAASGQEVPLPVKCPTCNGSGTMKHDGKTCVDCGGSGKDAKLPTDDALHRLDAGNGSISEGDPQGREKIDKSIDLYESDEDGDLEKAKLKAKARNALPDSAFALPGTREYPIHDENHARAALSMLHNASPEDQKKIKAAVHRRYPNIGADAEKAIEEEVAISTEDAEKADGSMFSAPNPNLPNGTPVNTDVGEPDDDNPGAPGSPAWEAVDAATATAAALALMEAAELMRTFAQREAMEVVAGEGNDIYDSYAVTSVLCGVNDALGVMAQMAFHEGLEAAKSLPDEEVVEKAGRRLAGKTVSALVAARDKATDLSTHITGVLGKDDPAKKSDTGGAAAKFIERANKAQLEEELSNMSTDELEKVLDARDERLVGLLADALKGKSAMDEAASTSAAHAENTKAKTRKKKVANTDDVLEDEAAQGDHDSASGTMVTSGTKAIGPEDDEGTDDEGADEPAEKAEADMTPEEIEARDAEKVAKKALKEAKRAKREAAQNAATAKAIEEAVAKATAAVTSLQEELANAKQATEDRLATVEKMAAPSTIAKTRPPEAINTSAERDAIDLEISRLENLARLTPEKDLRLGYRQAIKELRDKRQEVKS